MGLLVNTFLSSFICTTCHVALAPPHLEGHFKSQHPLSSFKIDSTLLNQTIETWDLADSLPDLVSDCGTFIEGLPLLDAWSCPHCVYFCGQLSSMKKHHEKNHSTLPKPLSWINIKAQQLDHGIHKTFLKVTPPESSTTPQPLSLLYDLRIQQQQSAYSILATEEDPRMVSPWLKTTGWHLHIAGYSPQELVDLVALPNKEEFIGLEEAVQTLFERTTENLATIPELILQKINTSDSAKR